MRRLTLEERNAQRSGEADFALYLGQRGLALCGLGDSGVACEDEPLLDEAAAIMRAIVEELPNSALADLARGWLWMRDKA